MTLAVPLILARSFRAPAAIANSRPRSALSNRLLLQVALVMVTGCSNSGAPNSGADGFQDEAKATTVVELASDNVTANTRPLTGTDWFDDITEASGLMFTYQNGVEGGQYTILESIGGGVGLLDIDLDGNTEIFCTGGGTIDAITSVPKGLPCELFRRSSGTYDSITSLALIPVNIDYSHGCTAGDIDNDGFPDIFVTCYGQNRLLRNNGDGTFTDATQAFGPPLNTWSTGAAFGDVDRDGNPELYVAGYVDWTPDPDEACLGGAGLQDVCSPQHYSAITDLLFFSSGDGHFHNGAKEAGIRNDGMGLGVVAADFDRDQKTDFYVANDVVANHLYLNWNGNRFAEAGELSGVGLNDAGSPEGSMGVDTGDFDGDGELDLWATNFEMEDNSLYRNLGVPGAFIHVTSAVALGGQGRRKVGFGTGFCDFDSDGWPDIYVLNGHVLYRGGRELFQQLPLLFQNEGGQRFEDISDCAGPWFSLPHAARGGAVGDLDGDGAPDLVVSSVNEPVAVLRNQRPALNWVRLRATGTLSPRHPVGTRATIHCFGRECVQVVKSGAGYLSHSDERLLFALSVDVTNVEVKVEWPSGREEVFTDLRTATDHVIIEGHGKQQ